MLKIGLLSDTHAWWDDKYMEYFSECDEIWHAGDIGSDTLAARLAALKPLRAVYGNIDGQSLRLQYTARSGFKAARRAANVSEPMSPACHISSHSEK